MSKTDDDELSQATEDILTMKSTGDGAADGEALAALTDRGRVRNQSPRFAPPSEAEKLAFLLGDPPANPHALDEAAVNSKLVVIRADLIRLPGVEEPLKNVRRAVIATPNDGEKYLPEGDIAHGLPEGSKMHKAADGKYVLKCPEPYGAAGGEGSTAIDLLTRAIEIIQG